MAIARKENVSNDLVSRYVKVGLCFFVISSFAALPTVLAARKAQGCTRIYFWAL
jgi:hypothetical protein